MAVGLQQAEQPPNFEIFGQDSILPIQQIQLGRDVYVQIISELEAPFRRQACRNQGVP